MKKKYVYFFGGGRAEGSAKERNLLGGKGGNLAEMTNLGIPVPPGFTISTEACIEYFDHNKRWPEGLWEETQSHLAMFGDVVLGLDRQAFGAPACAPCPQLCSCAP